MKEETKDKLYWFWEDVKEGIGDWIGVIFLFVVLGGCSSYVVFFKEDRATNVEEEYVYEPSYVMIYLINNEGVSYDSVKVEYLDYDRGRDVLRWEEDDLERCYNGIYLIEELE